jgi:hypothetical protein
MTVATKRQVTTALAGIGATLDDLGEGIFVIDSPAGQLWHTGSHTIMAEWQPVHESKADLWQSLLDDVSEPLERCNGWQDGLVEYGPCERCALDGLIG